MTQLIVVWSVQKFRRLAKDLPAAGDSVLEIGCSTGGTTRCLAARCARVVAVDLGLEVVRALEAEFAGLPHVTIARVDGRDTARLRELMPNPDLIFLDIGGTTLLGNVAAVLRECLQAFTPRILVVRNNELASVAALIVEAERPAEMSFRPTSGPDGTGETLRSLLDLSRSSNVSDRIFAARKLRKLGTPEARARLREMAADPKGRVRRIAELALKDEEREEREGMGTPSD